MILCLRSDIDRLLAMPNGRLYVAVAPHRGPGGITRGRHEHGRARFRKSRRGRILIWAGLDRRNRRFTLLHELVHEREHQGEDREAKATEVREFEAERVTRVGFAALILARQTARAA